MQPFEALYCKESRIFPPPSRSLNTLYIFEARLPGRMEKPPPEPTSASISPPALGKSAAPLLQYAAPFSMQSCPYGGSGGGFSMRQGSRASKM